jgi:hypothetical protein
MVAAVDAVDEQRRDRPTPQHAVRASVKNYNPLTTPLPNAPNMRLYCSYGHGLPTERAYHYKHIWLDLDDDQCPAVGIGTDLCPEQVLLVLHCLSEVDKCLVSLSHSQAVWHFIFLLRICMPSGWSLVRHTGVPVCNACMAETVANYELNP